MAITQSLIIQIVDILRQEVNRTIAQYELRTAGVMRLEAHRYIPRSEVIAVLNPASSIIFATVFATAGWMIDRRSCCSPNRIVVRPRVELHVVSTQWTNLAESDGVRRSIGDVAQLGCPLPKASGDTRDLAAVGGCTDVTIGSRRISKNIARITWANASILHGLAPHRQSVVGMRYVGGAAKAIRWTTEDRDVLLIRTVVGPTLVPKTQIAHLAVRAGAIIIARI